MSMATILASLRPGRTVYEFKSPYVDDDTPRTMVLSPDIMAAVDHPLPDTEEGLRRGELRAWLESFVEYGPITVAEDPFNKPPETMLARAHPVENEVWSI